MPSLEKLHKILLFQNVMQKNKNLKERFVDTFLRQEGRKNKNLCLN